MSHVVLDLHVQAIRSAILSMIESALHMAAPAYQTLRIFYDENLPQSLPIGPFGQVAKEHVMFAVGFVVIGLLYIITFRRRIRSLSQGNKTNSTCCRKYDANVSYTTRIRSSNSMGGGRFKEEVFGFMDTCAGVRKSLRKVQDPDQARAKKFQQLKESQVSQDGSTDHEDSYSHPNDLVEMCLDVRKTLHKVQDPDEARKAKLQHLKELELSRSAAEISKQHEQAGLRRMWKQ